MYGDQYQRVGIAKTAWRNGHRRVYGIFEHPDDRGRLYAKYEGYEEQRPDGVARVGLPSGGPLWQPEPLIDFRPTGYDFVYFFAQHQRPNPYIVRIPRDRVEYGPYPDERKAKAFARIGSQYGAPREVYYASREDTSPRKIRRYEGGRRTWPRGNPGTPEPLRFSSLDACRAFIAAHNILARPHQLWTTRYGEHWIALVISERGVRAVSSPTATVSLPDW